MKRYDQYDNSIKLFVKPHERKSVNWLTTLKLYTKSGMFCYDATLLSYRMHAWSRTLFILALIPHSLSFVNAQQVIYGT